MRFNTLDSVLADQLDFVPRERRGQISSLILAFVGAALVVFIFAYLPALESVSRFAPHIAIALFGLLGLYTTTRAQIDSDMVMSAEFQNMLFSQSLSLGSAFLMIVRRDGSIVHTSDGFAEIFPDFNYANSQALAGVFEQGTIRMADRDRLMGAIHSSTTERLVFPVVAQYRESKDYIITVEPLARPAGFSLIRGREYLGKRAGLQLLPDSLRSTSVDKLDHLLATTPTAHYTTDQYGRFEYVNPAFEQLLGYPPHAIVEAKLSLHHVFFSFNGQALTEEYTISDYAGMAIILNKTHGRLGAEVRQNIIRDGNGKAIGTTGSVAAA